MMHTTALLSPRHTRTLRAIGGLLLLMMSFAVPIPLAAAADIYTAAGSYSWVAPAGVTSVDVEAWGGGGAGGGNPTITDGGGGGGGGGYSKVTGITVVPGNSYTVTVGAGGIAVSGANGGNGGDSWFNNTATVLAKGGGGGAVPVAGAGGVAGTGGAAASGVGTVKFSGGNGGTGRNSNTGRGGPGGSSAGTAANGTSGLAVWATATAAAPPTGGGIGGNGGNADFQSGFAPSSGNGGGGGGGAERSTAGGNGADGQVIINYISAPLVTTDPASSITTAGATLNGTVTSNGASTTVTFNYGLTTAYGDTATAAQSPLASTAAGTPVSAAITGLACNTTYHYRVVGINSSGAANGADATFTTGSCVATATPTNCRDVAGIGTEIWTPNGVLLPATSSLTNTLTTTHFLVCSGYNFNIPATATIDGIVVGVSRYNAARGNIIDAAMRLVDAAGTIGTTDRSTTTVYPTQVTVGTLENHGTATDLWGATWTPTDINSANFGAAFASQYTGTNRSGHTVGVDAMPITIYYTPSANTAPNHLEIQHPSGTGITCSPATLTIKACADAACTVAYTNGVGGTLGATGSATVNWWNGTSFSIPAGSSTTTKDVQVTTPGSVVFDAATIPTAATATTCNFGSPSCTFTVADSAFLASVPNHAAETSTTLTLQAVKKADNSLACVPAFANASKTVNLRCAYGNPGSGTLPVRIAGTALNAAANAAAACDGTGANVALAFDANGIATPTLQYADVGQVSITASFTGAAGTPDAGLNMTGSASFVAAPATFSFSNLPAGPTIKAGASFSATITARNSAGAATPNFGKETTPESVTLSFTKCQPSGGSAGTFSGSAGAFSNGAATAGNLNWNEVGNGDLAATLASGNYLGSGLSATGNTGSGGTLCNTAGNVGRFIPDHFDTVVSQVAGVPMPCPNGQTCPTQYNGFVYSVQPFTVNVYARSLGGSTTQNYDNTLGYSKAATLSAWDAAGSTATQNPGNGTLSNNSVAASAFSQGTTALGTPPTPNYAFNSTPTVPTNVYLRAAEVMPGGDGVTSNRGIPLSAEGGVMVVSGRIRLSNAHGSELLPLPLRAVVQYWNGTTGYVTSATDNASSLAAANLNFTNCQKLSAASTWPATCPPPTAATPASVVFANGYTQFTLSAPGAGNSGSVDVGINVPGYLPSNTARATFGVYGTNNDFIYMRETY